MQESYERFTKTVTFRPLTGIRMIYRKCSIAWGGMSYLAMPCPIEVGIGKRGITEHGFIGMAVENDVCENDRYNQILLGNVKFALFMRMMELSRSVTGFSKNHLVTGKASRWTKSWSFLIDTPVALNEWMRIVSYHTNLDVQKFFSTIQSSITTYAKDLKLYDDQHWRSIGEETRLIEHLRNWVALMAMSYNLQHNAYSKLWYHHIRLQGDFCKLVQQVLKK